jgi:hypothetical protein
MFILLFKFRQHAEHPAISFLYHSYLFFKTQNFTSHFLLLTFYFSLFHFHLASIETVTPQQEMKRRGLCPEKPRREEYEWIARYSSLKENKNY